MTKPPDEQPTGQPIVPAHIWHSCSYTTPTDSRRAAVCEVHPADDKHQASRKIMKKASFLQISEKLKTENLENLCQVGEKKKKIQVLIGSCLQILLSCQTK